MSKGEKKTRQTNIKIPKISNALLIKKGYKSHNVAWKRLSTLLWEITSRNNPDLQCRNCLNLYTKKREQLTAT